jgi:hypothetical protein
MADPPLEAGAFVFPCWERGEDWQKRLLLTCCPPGDYESEIGYPDASRPAAARLWYCQTPDDDVYPHWLASPPLHGIVLAGATGLPDAAMWTEGGSVRGGGSLLREGVAADRAGDAASVGPSVGKRMLRRLPSTGGEGAGDSRTSGDLLRGYSSSE